MLAEELTRVSRSSTDRARANSLRVKKLREAGRVSDYDLLRAQVQVAERVTDSIRTANTQALAELALKNQIGFDTKETLTVLGTFREKGSAHWAKRKKNSLISQRTCVLRCVSIGLKSR